MKNQTLKSYALLNKTERAALKLANRFKCSIEELEPVTDAGKLKWKPVPRPIIWDHSKVYRVAK